MSYSTTRAPSPLYLLTSIDVVDLKLSILLRLALAYAHAYFINVTQPGYYLTFLK
jgi:hypothetical protein